MSIYTLKKPLQALILVCALAAAGHAVEADESPSCQFGDVNIPVGDSYFVKDPVLIEAGASRDFGGFLLSCKQAIASVTGSDKQRVGASIQMGKPVLVLDDMYEAQFEQLSGLTREQVQKHR